MKLQFDKKTVPYLATATQETREQEQTQEVKLPEGMPDVGTVLGCFGRPVLRSKQWRGNGMQASGGVSAVVLYAPEDGSEARSMEVWIPYQLRWDFPDTEGEGIMAIFPTLRALDARAVSPRKLLVRVHVAVLGEARVRTKSEVYAPREPTAGVELLHRCTPVLLPMEAGEKSFRLEEELTLPAQAPTPDRTVYFDVEPVILDQKVMAGKVVFRGSALLHILYRTAEGQLACWDFDIPFSQFSPLEQEFEDTATAFVLPALSDMELDTGENGTLYLKCGLIAQYVIYDRQELELVEDAYSVQCVLTPTVEELTLPVVLERRCDTLTAQQNLPATGGTVLLTAFYPAPMEQYREGDVLHTLYGGTFRVLYADEDGSLHSTAATWEYPAVLPADSLTQLHTLLLPAGRPSVGNTMAAELTLSAHTVTLLQQRFPMVTELDMGEKRTPDPNRPSLILRRAGDQTLWDMARSCGSTVAAIRSANHLEGEAAPGQLLLIPIA